MLTAYRGKSIAVYAPGMDVKHRDVDAVSGHIQVPLATIEQLVASDIRTTLITTHERRGRAHPSALPTEARIIRLTDASPVWPSRTPQYSRAVRQLLELVYQLNTNRWDLVHFFGQHRTFLLATVLSRLTRTPVAVTVMAPPPTRLRQLLTSPLGWGLRRQIDGLATLFTTTRWLADAWKGLLPSARVRVTRPGITKRVEGVWQTRQQKRDAKPNVVFWRNANRTNGADICIDVYRRLQASHPEAEFHFAVRPSDELESDLQRFAERTPRVHLHTFPYAQGPTLRELLTDATCCFFPFRRLSINPQMAVLETLYAGCASVTSDVESIPEILGPAEAPLRCSPPEDVEGHVRRISDLLNSPAEAHERGLTAGALARTRWNWGSYEDALGDGYGELWRSA